MFRFLDEYKSVDQKINEYIIKELRIFSLNLKNTLNTDISWKNSHNISQKY
jgi:hypothetical protein